MAPGDVIRTLVGRGDPADAVHRQRTAAAPHRHRARWSARRSACAGAVFQSVVRNPLGSPDMLGFTNGAATGALVAIVLAGGSSLLLAGGAVIGAWSSAD